MKFRLKRIILLSVLLLSLVLLTIQAVNAFVGKTTKDKVYSSIDDITYNKVGVLLGTSKYTANGNINSYYQYRIDATLALYKAGKITFVLVSGDNSTKSYDEPNTMKKDLIAGGIPAECIYLDYAGFRTLDSIIRSWKIFDQTKFTVISQRFHNERAIYIAEHFNLDVIGFNASDVSQNYGIKTMQREKLARIKMLIDLIFKIQPKFLGEKVQIG